MKEGENVMKKMQKFLIVLTVFLLCTLLALPAWAAVFTEGDGTQLAPYIIRTPEQLDAVRDNLGSHFKLNNDIDLTDYLALDGGGYRDSNGWEPIGDQNVTPFTGSFDGNDKKIIGLWINRTETNDIGVGLFGAMDGGEIKKLGVVIDNDEGGVQGNHSVGGLVGSVYGISLITNCYVTGDVSGNQGIGGLVGVQNASEVTTSYATGNVTGNSLVGGLMGLNSGKIANCYATGAVIDNSNISGSAGGLVGSNESMGEITTSYATGSVTAINYSVGGLVGSNSGKITNSYATGDITCSNNLTGTPGGIVGSQNDFGSMIMSNNYRYENLRINGNVLPKEHPSADYSPHGKHGGTMTAEQLMTQATYAAAPPGGTSWEFGPSGPWHWDDRGFPKLGMGEENFSFNFFSGGNGTQQDPYIIETAARLNEVRYHLDAHFKLGSDVDLEEYLADSDVGWVPIGTTQVTPFTGSFDGNGKKITGLWINRPSTTIGLWGLFGSAQNATIKNLGVELASAGIIGRNTIGGLVGHKQFGSIDNCYATGDVSATHTGSSSQIGGLAGVIDRSIIRNSYATGNVTGVHAGAGGLVGSQSGGSIIDSYATGNVTAQSQVGGLVGFSNSVISNSYATGNVTATTSSSGGLVGFLNSGSVSDSYATGNVTAPTDTGGLVGQLFGSYTITNSYRYEHVAVTENGVPPGDLSSDGPNTRHGGTVTAQQLMTRATYAAAPPDGTNWKFDPSGPWYWDDRGFPKLGMGEENFSFNFFSGGSGTQQDPYIIETAARLNEVRYHLDAHFKLGSDVDLEEYLADSDVGWVPIGTTLVIPFTGSFDGDGKKITGLWINRPTTTIGLWGLFGSVQNATIKNLGVELASAGIIGRNTIGGLVGHILFGSIDNCYATGDVSATHTTSSSQIGGLAGVIDRSIIRNSYATGNVTGVHASAGGLVGSQSEGSIIDSYAIGNVTALMMVGGLVGSSGGNILNSYATGNVTATTSISGGLVGNFGGNVSNSYATGNVTAPTGAGGLAGQLVGSYSITNSYRYEHATITENGVPPEDLSSDGPNTRHGGTVTAQQLMARATYEAAPPSGTNWEFDTSGPWHWDGRGFPKLGMGEENFPFSFLSEGSGTQQDPYIIRTAAHLNEVHYHLDAHFKLGGDVDLTDYLAPNGAGYAKWGAAGWEPIGTNTLGGMFTGTFNGAGYEITGLRIVRNTGTEVGLFGVINNGAVIENLGVVIAAAGGVEGNTHVGGLVGTSANSLIENCYVMGTVKGQAGVGVLVGLLFDGSIESCYATGSVNGDDHVGGLVGLQDNGSAISNSYATSTVTSSRIWGAGGLAGSQARGSSIANSYATGDINGGERVGGLVGHQFIGSIVNSYATGNVSGGGNVGAIVGESENSTLTNNYRFAGMTVGGTALSDNDPNGPNGGLAAAAELMNLGTYGSSSSSSPRLGWNFGPWVWEGQPDRGYPRLGFGPEKFPFSFDPEARMISIITQPAPNTTVTQGSITGSLSVAASVLPSGTPAYQWYSNTTNGNTGGAVISGAINASFAIPSTLTAGTYYYYCVVSATGADPKPSNAATVTVNSPSAPFVPVTDITGVPATATAGTPLNLTGIVEPSGATNKTIVWSVKDAGTTGAVINGSTLNATAAGTVTVTATIADGTAVGTDYTKDFTVTVTAAPDVPTYTISASRATILFGSLQTPYAQPEERTVTITNTGTGAITLTQPSAEHYDIGLLSTTNLAAANDTATFTVRPKGDLPVGNYNEAVAISGSDGAGVTVSLIFAVTASPPVPTIIEIRKEDLPNGTRSDVQVPTSQETFGFSDLREVVSVTGIDAGDFGVNSNGDVVVKDEIVIEVAETVVSDAVDKVVPLPVISADIPVPLEGESAAVAVVAFSVKGTDLMAEFPNNVRLLKILSSDPPEGELFEHKDNPSEFGDKKFTIMTENFEILFDRIEPEENYGLLLFIEDDGDFDLNKIKGVVVDPVSIISPLSSDGGGGWGCNSMSAGFASLALIAAFAVRKRRD